MKRAAHTRIERLEKRLPPVAASETDPEPEPMTAAEVWQMVCEDARFVLQGWGGRLAIKSQAAGFEWVKSNQAWLDELIAVVQEGMEAGYRPPIFLTSTEAETALAMLDAGAIRQCHDPNSGADDDPSTWSEVGFAWLPRFAGDPDARHLFLTLTDYTRYDEEQHRQSLTLSAVAEAIDLWDALTLHQLLPPGDYLAVDGLRAFLVMALDEARGWEGHELEAEV